MLYSYQKIQRPYDEVGLFYRQEDAERFSHSQWRYNTDGEAIECTSRSSHQRRIYIFFVAYAFYFLSLSVKRGGL